MKKIAAVILAAGKGTRMKSELAKVLHPLLGHPMISYVVDSARTAGAKKLVAVVGHQAQEVEEAIRAEDIDFAIQPRQLGTADAVSKAVPALSGFKGTLLILCGDVPLLRPETIKDLLRAHAEKKALATVLTMTPRDPTGYGRIVREKSGEVVAIVEERDADAKTRKVPEVNTGAYAVEAPWLWKALASVGSGNSQGEFYLTDIIKAAAREGRAASFMLADPDEALGINSRSHLAEASKVLRRRINVAWMEAGVSMEDPDSVFIEPSVTLSQDVVLGPNCRLEGKTSVASGCRIDAGAIISDSTLAANAHVKPYSVINGATLGESVEVGPFAHLRPGAVLDRKAKVGNFVEVKKSRLHEGVKASHLTYIGDAEIGEATNIGAGTITCNYDGEKKHRTVIGAHSFIGSNTALVAPVTIGEHSVIGAGSTITRDVPDGSLAVTRAQQKCISGWKNTRVPKRGEG